VGTILVLIDCLGLIIFIIIAIFSSDPIFYLISQTVYHTMQISYIVLILAVIKPYKTSQAEMMDHSSDSSSRAEQEK